MVQGGDQEARGDADRFLDVVVTDLAAVFGDTVALGEDGDQPRRLFEEGLADVRAQRLEGVQPFLRCFLQVELALLSLEARRMERLTSGSEMATKCQGCRLAPFGALPAARRQSSMISRGTGRSEKSRTLRRRFISA